MSEWEGKLSRADAIRLIERITDKDDPYWDWIVEDFYDEETDTMPTLYHIISALGISEQEYRLATGANGYIKWPHIKNHQSSPTGE